MDHGSPAHPAVIAERLQFPRGSTFDEPALLVLEDFATEQTPLEESYWLRRLLDRRQRTPGKAALVVSPVPIEAWDSQFACPLAADALVSRCSRAMAVIRLQE